jgi:hypothetical protein
MGLLGRVLPVRFAASLNSRAGQFAGLLITFNLAVGLLLSFIFHQYSGVAPTEREVINSEHQPPHGEQTPRAGVREARS